MITIWPMRRKGTLGLSVNVRSAAARCPPPIPTPSRDIRPLQEPGRADYRRRCPLHDRMLVVQHLTGGPELLAGYIGQRNVNGGSNGERGYLIKGSSVPQLSKHCLSRKATPAESPRSSWAAGLRASKTVSAPPYSDSINCDYPALEPESAGQT